MEAYPNLKPWHPGQSGNLNVRPVGSRSAFSAGDLAEVWAEKGKASMLSTAEKQPAVFFAICARLLPNDVRVPRRIDAQYSGRHRLHSPGRSKKACARQSPRAARWSFPRLR